MLMRKSKHVVPELCSTVKLRKKNKISIWLLGPSTHRKKNKHTQVLQMIPFPMPKKSCEGIFNIRKIFVAISSSTSINPHCVEYRNFA